MPRAEIIWKRVSHERETIQVKARHFGTQWKFFVRGARYEQLCVPMPTESALAARRTTDPSSVHPLAESDTSGLIDSGIGASVSRTMPVLSTVDDDVGQPDRPAPARRPEASRGICRRCRRSRP
jgi:hypothetical protein